MDNVIDIKASRRVRPLFLECLHRWERETLFMSSVSEITEHDDFKRIVALGENVVPFIIAELKTNPSCLVWALNLIYHQTISQEPVSVREASKSWIKWYGENHSA
jgi:hypothetical protein